SNRRDDRVELSHQVIDTCFRLVNEPLVMFDDFITRDKTSMRYQTHDQLKQKAVVRSFRKLSSDWRK
ncbi:hypothetical protein OK406_10750, partial [Streptococcus pneumoniae]|nr:hypothetical protein [Streptococcus pneumoniae]MDG7461526.1 hypothetical protein [Streptococcus pneumoniae]MDG7481584.1 hypothetical protein [Streptococcus pneumoniae]MDG7558939.1 hypothetical protein [Streptococcus pneumoniae]MDG8393626.1 hypothetical protein [Streptococcus pneumoniae]